MDFAKIAHILQGLESGAVTPEQGAILIDGIVEILNKLRPQLKKWWFRVMLDGVKVSFDGVERALGRNRMTIAEILQLADSGTTLLFAYLVWIELRNVRTEIVSVLHRIDGFIQARDQ